MRVRSESWPFFWERGQIWLNLKCFKTYPNGVKGLKNINLEIEQGEFVSIIGLSGAGKSTLIRTINRMIEITEGTLTVDGTNVSSLKGKSLRKFRRNKVGMIFQSFNLVTRTTVIKNVFKLLLFQIFHLFVHLFGIYTKEEKITRFRSFR